MVEDRRTGRTLAIRADIVINASGPWSDEIRRLAVPSATPTVRGTKGAHIAVPRARVGNIGAVTLLSPIDDRVMFVLPAGAHTIIGTTDTEYAGSAEEARATVADVSYLLRSTNAFFPAAHLTMDDVVSAWAGVRPLAAPGGRVSMRNPDAASREHAIDWTAPGLLTITGGKLTTYRAMAAEVVRTAMRKLAAAPKRGAPTDREPLPGGVMSSLDAELASARLVVHDDDVATHLVHAYGGEWSAVWALAQRDSAMAERVIEPLPYIAAEIRFAVEHAFAATLGDVLIRRLHVAFETRDHGRSVASYAASIIAPLLDWDHAEIERQLERYGIEVERMFGIDG
jgi:glycerol-3-phosphate dehydrogenase